MPIAATYLTAIQKFEGFSQRANWDYAQYTNGYGTKAQSPTETISRTEADRRFKAEISGARNLVEGFAPGLDSGTKAALTSLTFNAGTAWMKSGLGEAVKSGELDQVRDIFVQYNRAGGKVLPGLVARRAAEVSWIGDSSNSAATEHGTDSPSTVSRSWTRGVLDPMGMDAHDADNKPAVYPSAASFLVGSSAQLLAQVSLDVWDFLTRADATEATNRPDTDQTEA